MDYRRVFTVEQVREDLSQYPPVVVQDFEEARHKLGSALTEAQLSAWATAGLRIARQNVRSWEAAAQFFQATPTVLGHLHYSQFQRWVEAGVALNRESSTLAAAFFQASPGTVARLRPRHIEVWARLGRELYKGTWKSSSLACKFFAATPALLDHLSFAQVERFAQVLDALSRRSYDLASECLDQCQGLFPLVEADRGAFISLVATLVEYSWRELKSFLEAAGRALPRVTPEQRLPFLALAEGLARKGLPNIPAIMLETSLALTQLRDEDHGPVLRMAAGLVERSPAAVAEFIKASPSLLERTTLAQLEQWYQEGLKVLEQNPDGGLAFFKMESSYAERVLEAVSSSVELERVKEVMELYCRALAGAEVKLEPTQELVEKNIGWVSAEAPSTEGSTVYVPATVDRYPTKAENFAWLKVVSTHQVAHLEFGSFLFEFERPATLFDDLRPRLEEEKRKAAGAPRGDDGDLQGAGAERAWVTDMQRFFDLFEDRRLALDIFTVVEDGRLDARVRHEYRGIRKDYARVQRDALQERPDIKALPAREALVELLVRLSLQQEGDLPVPVQYIKEALRCAAIARRVFDPTATVEDVAEATLRIYAIIAAIPNEEVAPEDWDQVDLQDQEQEDYQDSDELETLLERVAQGMEMELRPESEEGYDSVQEVEFRGDFKPELVQLLSRLRLQKEGDSERAQGEPLTQEQLEELLQNSAELELEAVQGDIQSATNLFVSNMLKEAGLNVPQNPQWGQGPLVHVEDEGGSLEPSEPETYVYDEWDFRAEDYKPRWCIVRQKIMAEGDASFYGNTLHQYGVLVKQIRRQFELMVPEMLRKVRKLEDGEEIDFDDVVEAMVDIKTGASPSDKIYWRRNKIQRDVAVVFLLDISASTAEAIDDTRRLHDDDAPDDPVEYMMWLRSRRGEGMLRTYKRIIDVEKEATVLLINALESIGDLYGIYCFSGYGRENVEFYTVKDLNEQFSERVKRRIERIAPLHATRMGPAIRHAASKLEKTDARTKLLFLISDGRPQDRGYSREGVEKEYAVHDTKMALTEARRKSINAFCLTVDKNGHDYLGTMCQDMGYEVLDDVYALPQRLLYLYRKLTM